MSTGVGGGFSVCVCVGRGGLCGVWREGRGSSAPAGRRDQSYSVYAHISLAGEACSDSNTVADRCSLVPRQAFPWRRSGRSHSFYLSLCDGFMLSWFKHGSRSPNLVIVLTFWPHLLKLPYWVCFCKGRVDRPAPLMTFLPVLNVIKADILFCSRSLAFQFSISHLRLHKTSLVRADPCLHSAVWLSTITTTEDVWTCWLPWQQGLGRGCCCVDGVHRKTEGPTGRVCGTEPFFSSAAATSAALSFIRKDKLVCYC